MSIFAPAATTNTPPDTLTPLLARRVKSAGFHAPSVQAVDLAIEKLRYALDGHISTDMVRIQHGSVLTETPSRDIARVDVGILPTGIKRHWQNRGAFTPDAALGISLFFTDNYTYSPQNDPLPSGRLSFQLLIRSWGKLSSDEITHLSRTVDGISTTYGMIGFDTAGTSISLTREEGRILQTSELEHLLAPLIPHVFNYFTLMHIPHPGNAQGHGNFSDKARQHQEDTLQLHER